MNSNYVVDCHLEIEDDAGNVVFANGNHQVAITTWVKISDANKKVGLDISSKVLENVQLSLIDLESGHPLGKEWIWSTEKKFPKPVKREDGETGSKPDDETGYLKKTIYLSHALDHENDGNALIGVQVSASVEPGKTLSGVSGQGVRIKRRRVGKYTSGDFNKAGPFYDMGVRDDVSKWSIDSDQRNLWRFANFTITFKDPEKAVSKVAYNGNLQEGTYPIYSTRRAHLFETAAYVWPFEDAPHSRQQKVALWFPDNTQVKSINYADAGGFTITLVTYVRTDVWVKDDSWNEAGDTSIVVYDEQDTPITLFLNPVIPNTWNLIKQNKIFDTNQSFTEYMLADVAMTLDPVTKYEALLKNETYGYTSLDQYYPSVISCKNTLLAAYGLMWAGNTNQVLFQMYNNYSKLAKEGWYPVIHNGDILCMALSSDSGDEAVVWTLYPRWDLDAFCISITIKNDENRLLADSGNTVSGQDHVLYTKSDGGEDGDWKYIWYFTPQGA